jgi:2-phosphosulfolactate phosphatase
VVIQVDLELRARDAGKAVGRGDLIIVIDVLRSGTSILNALTNGAQAAVPAMTLEEAYKLRSKHPEYLLAGERGGHKPVGFDLGNSPLEFTPERVEGKTLVITTTSGTAALVKSKAAKWIFLGGFLNALAAARKAEQIATRETIGVSFVLAGEKGKFSLEDFLCAGAIANGFTADKVRLSDKVQAALLAFKQAENNLTRNVMKAKHAEHLVQLGFKRDVDFSCSLNVFRTVPIYADGKITLHQQTASSSL